MNNEDNLSKMIDNLLKTIKKYALIETGDGKYLIYLKKESLTTLSGKSYEIIISDKNYNVFGKENDKQ